MKAMILAAGRGARMQPITDTIPKPLLKVAGKPLIAHHLITLARAGIAEVVINISHLAEKIQQELGDGQHYNIKIHYSHEPIALETGGGILQALPLLGTTPFLVVSGDIWTDYPWQQLPQQLENDLAHLIMVDNPSYHVTGDFVLQQGKLQHEGGAKLTFASMGVYHPKLFAGAPSGAFRLTKLLDPAIAAGKVSGEHYHGNWANVGTEEEWHKLIARL